MLPTVSRSTKRSPALCTVVAATLGIALLFQFTYFRSQTSSLILKNEKLQEDLQLSLDKVDEMWSDRENRKKELKDVEEQKVAAQKQKDEISEKSRVRGMDGKYLV